MADTYREREEEMLKTLEYYLHPMLNLPVSLPLRKEIIHVLYISNFYAKQINEQKKCQTQRFSFIVQREERERSNETSGSGAMQISLSYYDRC